MYSVYIIYSSKLDRYYIGTTNNFEKRLSEHNSSTYPTSYTTKGIPWELNLEIAGLSSSQAYQIERHIKKMKSKKYISSLKEHIELIEALKIRFM